MSDPRYRRYPGIMRFLYLAIPGRSGIFRSHTHDTHAYSGMEYPGYIPGVCRVRYLSHGFEVFSTLPYRVDKVFSDVIPTIPTIPRYFEISIPYHTGSIRYFQQSYPRYPRVPRYGIPRVYTRGMPGTVPHPRFLCKNL